MKRLALGLTCFVLGAALLCGVAVLCFADKDDLWKEAEAQYAKKNYKDALDLYRRAFEAGGVPDAGDGGRKIVICLARLGRWDESVKEADALAKTHEGTAWEARAVHLRGNLLFEQTHYGSRTQDGKFTRAQHVRGAYWEDTTETDFKAAQADLEKARGLYYRLEDKAAADKADAKPLRAESAELDMDIARFFEGMSRLRQFRALLEEKKEDLARKAEGRYDPSWSLRLKVAFAYGEAEAYDASADRHFSVIARYRRAMFFRQVGPVRDSEQPLPILESLLKDFPKDSLADEALFAWGMILEQKEDFLGAKAKYAELQKEYAQSPWASDAKAHAREIERPRVIVDSSGVRLPGSEPKVKVRTRNAKKLQWAAFPVRLEKLFADRRNDAGDWTNFFDRFLSEGGARELWGVQAAEWDSPTKDAGDHKWVEDEVAVPLAASGAYVLEAKADSVVHTSVLLVSDLGIIRKMDGTRMLLFVTDAVTGQAVPGASVAVRERWASGGVYHTNYWEDKTGGDGVLVRALESVGRLRKQVQAFAWVGDRFAATGHQRWYGQAAGAGAQVRIYAFTERPVYRPEQDVRFKALLRQKDGGEYRNLPGEKVLVEIFDPKNKRLFSQTMEANEFGSVQGSVKLDKEPPLGMYRIRFQFEDKRNLWVSPGSQFRVEEYKKPEFEVTVSSEKPQVKLGQSFRAKINAKYYFGGAVANADLTYRVFRRDYWHSYVPEGEFDWLYGRGYGWTPWWYYVWGPRRPVGDEMVLSGETKTDADGNAFVEIDTAKFAELGKELGEKAPDHLFVVKAEVRDESRRTIEGEGQIKVTRKEFYAFLETPRGFFEKGEKAKFEIRTMNASNAPVQAKGTVQVSLLLPPADPRDEKAEPVRKLLFEQPGATDERGLLWFEFVPDAEGKFEVAYRAKDAWGGEVVGRREIWAVGDQFEGWRFRFADIELLTDKRSYEEGETARIMVNTNHRGAHLLFTLEAETEILEWRVLPMGSKSAVIQLPLTKAHVPNFFIRAALLAGGKPCFEEREIFVPPAKQFLDVRLAPSKPEYKPGEKASWSVQVRDRRGSAVQCEVSLGVIDRSVLYIQPEFAPDVRVFFYGDRRASRLRPDNSLQHGFSREEQDSRFYPEIETHGYPPGWRGYGNWRDYFGDEPEMDSGARLGGARRSGGAPSGGGAPARAAGEPQGERLERAKKNLAEEGSDHNETDNNEDFEGKALGKGGAEKEPAVRTNFADTAFWSPCTVTGTDGTASFEFVMPDSLTAWKATVVAADAGPRVGTATAGVVTRKNLMVRLAAPRFFTERDEVVLSALVNNYLSTKKDVRVEWTLEGGCLEALGEASVRKEVEAGAVGRVDFRVRAVKEGEATVLVKALTDEESDAMKLTFPVLVHGTDKAVTVCDVMKPYDGSERKVRLTVPAERDPRASRLEITVTPSLASCLLDALPYLIEYPYGCAEQTMSRFLPAVVVARTLKELKVDLETIGRKRAEMDAARLAERVKTGWHVLPDPVFDTGELNQIVRLGLDRLAGFQKADGGFGWWPGGGQSDPYMTAYVAFGLMEAKKAGYEVDATRIGRAVAFLKAQYKDDKSLHRRAYIAWVLAQAGAAGKEELDAIYDRREDLNLYTKCLLTLALHLAGRADEAKTTVENVLQFATVDPSNKTCFIDTGSKYWWHWYNDKIESTVFLLRALMAVNPKDERNAMIVRWLVNNRQGSRWASTKDTANAVYALAEYIRAEDELNPEYTVSVDWPGVASKEFQVTKSNVFTFDNKFVVEGEKIPAGVHDITIRRDGKGAVYFTAHLAYFSKEEDVKGAGHELFVNRSFSRMIAKKRTETRNGREVEVLDWERIPLKPGEAVKSGERIEVRIDIEAKNQYDYLVFEDMKPAGLEPVQLRSGYSYGNLCSNMELRDEKVVFFVDTLDTGKYALIYVMRAEVPGAFHAMPTRAFAMYAPKVGGISDEWRIEVRD